MSRVEYKMSHWSQKRLRFLVKSNPSISKNLEDETLVSFLPMEKIKEYGGLTLDIEKSVEEVKKGYTYFADNDIIIAKITPCFENGKGSLCKDLFNGTGFGTTELYVLRPLNEIDSSFLFYLTISHPFRKHGEAEMLGAGGQKRVPEEFIKNYYLSIPLLIEQQSIAQFLDYKTEQIDKLVEKKEKFLKLLEEKRIALITNAVTGKLNSAILPLTKGAANLPAVAGRGSKDSGVAWLVDIPQHWSYAKTMYLSKIITGGTPSKNNPEYWEDGDINWLNSGEINKKIIYEVTKKITAEGKENSNASAIPPKSVLIALNGQGKTKGSVAVLEVESTCSQSLAAIVPNKKINYKYLYFFLESKYKEIRGLVGEARDGLNLDHVKSFVIPIPPMAEQKFIIEFIEIELVKINQLTEQVNKAIEKLKEYRTSLITSAVTGKIDLRNWQSTNSKNPSPQSERDEACPPSSWRSEACTEQSRSVEEVN